MQVGAVAVAKASGACGILLGAAAVGEVLGGFLYCLTNMGRGLRWQIMVLHAATSATLAAMGLFAQSPILLLLYLAAGLSSGARDAIGQYAVGIAAPQNSKAEAYAWMTSFMWSVMDWEPWCPVRRTPRRAPRARFSWLP
jgi:hypothetical protein